VVRREQGAQRELTKLDTKAEGYYLGTRHEMLRFIPEGVDTVLEVGCAAGGFGLQLKQRGIREVWGVEVVESAGQQARKVLDKVLIGDIADLIDELPVNYFDVVVFNDVLEHLVDPFTVLTRIKSRISERGMVVSSIPNIRYYHTLTELVLHKNWEYMESGILDRTHLRFFTVLSIRSMYERLGYEVLRHEGNNPMKNRPMSYRLVNLLLRGGISDTQYEQFVTWARPIVATSRTQPAGPA
jgi:2-polyprenyl-3-methyl-5-hydroxy-6-metoxy-1,4-benzoquinol methylase